MSVESKTLKGLAQQLGVSITTVSRALADHPSIALKTRERIAKAAQDYGYVPNRAARQLVSGRSGFAGFVMPIRGLNFSDAFLGEFVTGLGEGLVTHGLDLFLATVQQGQAEIDVLRHVVESGRADGLVVPRIAEDDERVRYLSGRSFPFVAHGRLLATEAGYHWLDTDGERAFAQAFDMLYDLGHRHIGLVTISDAMTFRHHRELGLKRAIAAKGDPSVKLTIESFPRFNRGESIVAVNRLLHAPDRPTAIIGLFDEIALTVLEEAARCGLTTPRDLSVVGFDNITPSAYAPPGLTTFDSDYRSCAREIAHLLVEVIETRPNHTLTRLIQPKLVARASHGPAPQTVHRSKI